MSFDLILRCIPLYSGTPGLLPCLRFDASSEIKILPAGQANILDLITKTNESVYWSYFGMKYALNPELVLKYDAKIVVSPYVW